jgi:hypothetical protein
MIRKRVSRKRVSVQKKGHSYNHDSLDLTNGEALVWRGARCTLGIKELKQRPKEHPGLRLAGYELTV